jgi:hypothetical protein
MRTLWLAAVVCTWVGQSYVCNPTSITIGQPSPPTCTYIGGVLFCN